jgi:type IV secretory pathway VirB6-like protein
MDNDEIKNIIYDLKKEGFKLSAVERHLGIAKGKFNNYRFGMTSFTDAEKASLVKYHKDALKLAGKI